jgi:hypothetical protein
MAYPRKFFVFILPSTQSPLPSTVRTTLLTFSFAGARKNSMPTFIIFKNSKVSNTIRGADPNQLRSAIMAAAADAAKGPARQSAAFQSAGRTLGSDNSSSSSSSNKSGSRASSARAGGALGWLGGFNFAMPEFRVGGGLQGLVVRFVGLYLTSLFSVDAYGAAEASAFNANRR